MAKRKGESPLLAVDDDVELVALSKGLEHQADRLYDVYKANGTVDNFEQVIQSKCRSPLASTAAQR